MDKGAGELTDAVMKATRGLRAATAHLASLLPTKKLLLAIVRPVPPGSKDVAFHGLPGPNGETFCPLFTDERLLSAVGHRRGWTTDGGPLELLEWSGTVALSTALDWAEAGAIRGVVLNPFHPSALELLPEEMRGLLNREPRALRRHLLKLPIQPDEKFITRRVQGELPQGFLDAIQQAIRSQPEFAGYGLIEVISEERDAPSLLLSVKTKIPIDGPTGAQAIDRFLSGKTPAGYSHVDIMFDGAGTKQKPRR